MSFSDATPHHPGISPAKTAAQAARRTEETWTCWTCGQTVTHPDPIQRRLLAREHADACRDDY